MCSLPYSLLVKADSDILPQSIIQEHQNFCKLFIKYQSSYERKKEENKAIKDSASTASDKNKDYQNHIKIWNWFENLPLEEKIKVCTIKNKWLVKIIIQLYFFYYIDDKCTFAPIHDMTILFSNQNNYKDIGSLLYKNIQIIPSFNDKKNFLGYNEDDYCKYYFSVKESDFPKQKKKDNLEQKELEKKFIDNIILIALEDETLDSISINIDLLKDVKYFKKILNFFSDKECFKDWLEPFNYNNFYNFTFPKWMHNNTNLTICKILSGIFEQQILLLYEYFFYSKKIYEFNGINFINDIYTENKKLEKFIVDNYSYEGKMNNMEPKKENIITFDVICDVVNKIKKDIKYKNKFDNFKNMLDQLYNDYYKSQFYIGNKILSECSENIYKELLYEMKKEKGKEINSLLNKITFMKLDDIKNSRELIYIFLRKYLIDLRNKTFINELLNEDENKSGKKKKKKKKKNKNINPLNIIANEDILKNNEKEKEVNKVKEIIKDNISLNNNNNINSNKNNLNENTDNINDGNNSSSSNDNNKNEEKENIIYNKKAKENEDTFITIKQIDNNEKEEQTINNIEQNQKIKEPKNKNKQFFLFPLKNKKRKNKNKNNKLKENNIKEEEKSKEEKENNNKKEEMNEEIKSINKKDIKINEIKEESKNKNIIKNEEEKKGKKQKQNSINLETEPKNESITKNESLLKSNNKLELSQISAISIQMLNESKNKNINKNEGTSEKTISIEKQNQIEINKFCPKPELTTSFSYNPVSKIQTQTEIETKSETIKEKEDTKNPVNMTINIINNQYIYQQYPFINNFPFMQFMYCYHSPSESFFNLLSKEINCYNNYTCKNIEYLNTIKSKYLNKVEKLIKTELKKKYMIKFGHYGSYFTNLSIEGSDIDILVYYKPNNPNFIFLQDILDLLNKHENEFDLILPILSASVPVIKLQINITNEIDNNLIQMSPYFENKDISHMKIDLTFTSDETEFKRPEQIVLYTNKYINIYNNIKPLLLVLKRYFRIMKMNKSFTGGLSSFSLFLLILSFFKSDTNNNGINSFNNTSLNISSFSLGKLLYCILEKYSFFDYKNYGINVEGPEYYYLLQNNILDSVNMNNAEYNNYNYEINILDPFTKLNVAKSSFQVDEIKNTFNKALYFLKYEAWKYDTNNYSYNFGYNNDKETIEEYKNNENDFIIIKKLFNIK